MINLVKDISDATNALPCNIILQDVIREGNVFREKRYAVVHKGDYRGVEVAMTVIQELDHTSQVSQVRVQNIIFLFLMGHCSFLLFLHLKRWRRQIVTWRQLDHENVTKIIGVCQDIPYCLVSEFQPESNVREHLKKFEEGNQQPDYIQLVSAPSIAPPPLIYTPSDGRHFRRVGISP